MFCIVSVKMCQCTVLLRVQHADGHCLKRYVFPNVFQITNEGLKITLVRWDRVQAQIRDPMLISELEYLRQ